jgi:hypothetical protein
MPQRFVSPTVTSAAAGALFVGLATAILFALAIGPAGGIPFGFAEVALSFVMGAVFGTIAGGVAGASEVTDAVDAHAAVRSSPPDPERYGAGVVRSR